MAARVGIDLGTTNTVVALADRGNYPVLPFATGRDGTRLSLPTMMAYRPGPGQGGQAPAPLGLRPGRRHLRRGGGARGPGRHDRLVLGRGRAPRRRRLRPGHGRAGAGAAGAAPAGPVVERAAPAAAALPR